MCVCSGSWTNMKEFLLDRVSVFVSSVILYSSLPGLEVPKKLHWNPGEPVSVCVCQGCMKMTYCDYSSTLQCYNLSDHWEKLDYNTDLHIICILQGSICKHTGVIIFRCCIVCTVVYIQCCVCVCIRVTQLTCWARSLNGLWLFPSSASSSPTSETFRYESTHLHKIVY